MLEVAVVIQSKIVVIPPIY